MTTTELPALPETTYKLGRQGGANPYGDGYEPDWVLPQAAYDADQMRAYATAYAAAGIARLQAQVDALAGALQAMMRADMRGHELADRLQFSTPGREILEKCRAALAAAGR